MNKIKIIQNTVIAGEHIAAGKSLTVPKQCSLKDAVYLVQIGKAVDDSAAVEKKQTGADLK